MIVTLSNSSFNLFNHRLYVNFINDQREDAVHFLDEMSAFQTMISQSQYLLNLIKNC